MNFAPVSTKADLDTLNDAEIVEGYLNFRRGDPEPGPNRGRSYWHGFMNAARDAGERPETSESARLAAEVVAGWRERA